jgi:hypothetical protein
MVLQFTCSKTLRKKNQRVCTLQEISTVPGTSVAEPKLVFTVPVPTFDKLRFGFRFQLLTSYDYELTVPVPAPYLDHTKPLKKM